MKYSENAWRVYIAIVLFVSIAALPLAIYIRPAHADTGVITWQDNSQDEDGFIVERQLNSAGPWDVITTVGANTRSYTDNTLVQTTIDNVYCYRVAAFNKGGKSGYTPITTKSCKTIAKLILPPNAPSDTTAQ